MSAEIESSTTIVFLSGPDTSDRLGRYDPEGPQAPPISVLLLSGMRADGKSAHLGRRTRNSCAVSCRLLLLLVYGAARVSGVSTSHGNAATCEYCVVCEVAR